MNIKELCPRFDEFVKFFSKRQTRCRGKELVSVKINKVNGLRCIKYTHYAQNAQCWSSPEFTTEEHVFFGLVRGIIVDKEGEIIAFPYQKFHNLGEQQLNDAQYAGKPFRIEDKRDGNLVTLFNYEQEWQVASSGSFTSPVQQIAQELIKSDQYKYAIEGLDPEYTYVLELIAPQTRIIVDYGTELSLTLLGVIDKHSGTQIPIEFVQFPHKVTTFDFGYTTLQEVYDHTQELELSEGYVIKFGDGQMFKVKSPWYYRMAKALDGVNGKKILDVLKTGEFAYFYDSLEPEIQSWATDYSNKIQAQHAKLKQGTIALYHELAVKVADGTISCTIREYIGNNKVSLGGGTYQKILFAIDRQIGETGTIDLDAIAMWDKIDAPSTDKPTFN
jgi:T4 RnlA family RNA ligase